MAADKYLCPICYKPVAATVALKFRKHNGEDGVCDGTGSFVPSNQVAKGPIGPDENPGVPVEGRDFGVCEDCGRNVKIVIAPGIGPILDRHNACPGSGAEYIWKDQNGEGNASSSSPPPSPTATAPIPGAEEYAEAMSQARTSMFQQPGRVEGTIWTPDVTNAGVTRFQQPGKAARAVVDARPMTPMGAEIAAQVKQLFFHYGNRRTSDNRAAQSHLGPSEIGSSCDRRIVMSLLGIPAVNPGGDGWAAFVGTCIHSGLAEMFSWANADTGRYVVEAPLEFPSAYVPRGTADLLDRTLLVLDDHKCMGRWSLDKLRTKGPSDTYRVQVHTYAYGHRLKGEKVEHVAIIAWPREASSLDDLYVWAEPYDPTVARDALKRVDELAAWVSKMELDGGRPMEIAQWSGFNSQDCRYCPFHAPGDTKFERGCRGRD